MQPEERDAAYLWDMLDAARAVREFVSSRKGGTAPDLFLLLLLPTPHL